jgi:hypothetical protein
LFIGNLSFGLNDLIENRMILYRFISLRQLLEQPRHNEHGHNYYNTFLGERSDFGGHYWDRTSDLTRVRIKKISRPLFQLVLSDFVNTKQENIL